MNTRVTKPLYHQQTSNLPTNEMKITCKEMDSNAPAIWPAQLPTM